MEVGQPDVIEQLPATGNPMEPKSGTYGDVADTDRLKQQLDLPGQGPGGTAGRPTPPPVPGAPQGRQLQSSAGGVPEVLLRPSGQPATPQNTPLGPLPPTAPGAVNGAQRRLAILQALTTSDEVSDEVREWAQLVLEKLASRQT